MTALFAPCPALRRARLVPVSAEAPVPGADRSPRLRNTRRTGFCGYCGDAEGTARRILPGAVRPAEPLTCGRLGGVNSGNGTPPHLRRIRRNHFCGFCGGAAVVCLRNLGPLEPSFVTDGSRCKGRGFVTPFVTGSVTCDGAGALRAAARRSDPRPGDGTKKEERSPAAWSGAAFPQATGLTVARPGPRAVRGFFRRDEGSPGPVPGAARIAAGGTVLPGSEGFFLLSSFRSCTPRLRRGVEPGRRPRVRLGAQVAGTSRFSRVVRPGSNAGAGPNFLTSRSSHADSVGALAE